MTERKLPAAVLWDMDGTLIDSEPDWIAAETALAAEHGVEWTHEDGLAMVGNPLPVSAQMMIDRGVAMAPEAITDSLLASVTASVRGRVPWQEDGRALYLRLRAQGIPTALVTMSYASLAEVFVAATPGFDAVVTGDAVANGKPHPESYLTAAAALGVDIADCLAIEDSPSGVRSAVASGARAVGVKRLSPVDALPRLSRVRSLDSLTDEAIARIMAGEVLDELGDGD